MVNRRTPEEARKVLRAQEPDEAAQPA